MGKVKFYDDMEWAWLNMERDPDEVPADEPPSQGALRLLRMAHGGASVRAKVLDMAFKMFGTEDAVEERKRFGEPSLPVLDLIDKLEREVANAGVLQAGAQGSGG
jgi:hypothetical protein